MKVLTFDDSEQLQFWLSNEKDNIPTFKSLSITPAILEVKEFISFEGSRSYDVKNGFMVIYS